jgi:hypothetical protein
VKENGKRGRRVVRRSRYMQSKETSLDLLEEQQKE